jgi:GxxExxY protein
MMQKHDLPEHIERLAREIIGCAIEVHRGIGPGLLESLYETAMVYELEQRSIPFRRQADIVVPYKTIELHGQRLDLLVQEAIVVELKAITALADIHTAQVLSYTRALDLPLGVLFNFNVPVLSGAGMRRVFNKRWSGLKPLPSCLPSNTSISSETSS